MRCIFAALACFAALFAAAPSSADGLTILGAGRGIQRLQGNSSDGGPTSRTSYTVVLASPVQKGSIICVGLARTYSAGATVSVTDDLGNTYTVYGGSGYNVNGYAIWSAYALVTATGTPTITATWSVTNTYLRMVADEFSGGFTAVDGNNGAAAAASTSLSANVTTTKAVDLLYGAYISSAGTPTKGATFNQGTVGTLSSQWRVAGPSGASPVNFTNSSSTNMYIAGLAAQ